MSNIAVIGAGAWGTALSIALARQGRHGVSLWAYEKEVRESIAQRGTNDLLLPEQAIPPSVRVSNDFGEVLGGAEILVSVMPSHHTRRVFQQMAPHLTHHMLFVSATKGVENDSLLRMSEVICQVLAAQGIGDPRIGALSGPSFAKEVATGDPTAITVGSKDVELATTVQREFSDHTFRIYTNHDIVGVELGGALKNVIAIAAGVCDGLGLGHNTIAALITRGLAEIARLAVVCGARQETLAGLAGIGDLVLTCTGGLSRNRTVGVELGKGRRLDDIIAGMRGMVAEGVLTTNAAVGLAQKMNVEMPISEQMYAILHQGKSPRDAIRELMTRRGASEVTMLNS
jgi:glycerol-3-phosphate dehydrogenase (NAD(P)+)